MKSPNELLQELTELVTSLEKDADKSTRGMKAAGIRFRAAMQQVRDMAIAARKSVLEYRNSSSKTEEVEEAPEVEVEASEFDIFGLATEEAAVVENSQTEEVKEEDNFLSFWYSKFTY